MLPPDLQKTFRLAFKHHNAGRLDKAEALYRQLLTIVPHDADVLQLLGTVHLQKGDLPAAVAHLQRSLDISPNQPAVRQNLAQAWFAQGTQQQNGGHFAEAADSFARAVAFAPAFVEAINNLGVAKLNLSQWEEALAHFRQALALQPSFADAAVNVAAALNATQRYGEALPAFRNALALKPDSLFLKGVYLHARQHLCDWNGLAEDIHSLLLEVDAGKPAATPFSLIATPATPAQLYKTAKIFSAVRHPASASPLWCGERYGHAKIRIGYFSPDFYDHATTRLLVGAIEHHDRNRFEISAYAWGPSPPSPTRDRIAQAFGGLVDIGNLTDRAAAELARRNEIDIAVDVSGITQFSRPNIFAQRPAPIQASYLAFPGTTGAPYMDYLIADGVVVPPEHQAFYTEKIVTLPESYQANDAARAVPVRAITRAELGLPEKGFVFASFNNSYKISPALFDVWMQLLRDVPGAVLWLLQGDDLATANLKREAQTRGIAPERLVFAARVPTADHWARHAHADLFLDTIYCNGHTTTSDALWMGGAVVTCAGTTFAGRVSESLLAALGVPELVAPNLEAYAQLARDLAGNPERLMTLKAKIAANRTTYPLFDTVRFTRHLEAAYAEMHARCQRGEAPAAFAIPALTS